MRKRVLIMLACYNGEKYIREQLESIISQTYSEWNLVVQDDGSTDDTIAIVNEYCAADSRITVRVNDSNRHGAFPNFHVLANSFKKINTYDYYMFSDQDDIWDSRKIETMVRFFEDNTKAEIPSLVYADMRTIDQTGTVLESSIDRVWKISGKNRYSYFFSHKVFGCNLMMNSSLFHTVPVINVEDPTVGILSHDNLYAKFAATFGEVFFLDEVLMSYRRHGGNQTTEQQYRINIKRIVNRLLDISRLAEQHARAYNQTLYTLTLLKSMNLNEEQISLIYEVEYIIRHSGFATIHMISKRKIKWGSYVENTSHKLVLFLGLHKKHIDMKC